ncbi:MAG: UDP-2,3-diacylglucosamine diphosphatase [Reichenbachiella sp.]
MKKHTSLAPGKKAYFASDFHLGAPNPMESSKREQIIVRWLDAIKSDAGVLILVGDLFDFWFEYRHVVPKGYVRFLGKLAELNDSGMDIVIFTGNHDLWMQDYLETEIGAQVVHHATSFDLGNKRFHVAHGDGLDPQDWKFRLIKRVFTNPLCQWLFRMFHPDFGITLANWWSSSSREELQNGHEDLYLIDHSENIEKERHHDFYIYGDCHFDKEVKLEGATYYNLGDWINKYSYLEFDGEQATLKRWVV